MQEPRAAFFPITLAAIIIAAGAQAQDAREGRSGIANCQTISEPGSYKLVSNLTLTSPTPVCLPITADFVTIDLAGFTISGQAAFAGGVFTTAIEAGDATTGITVRNGSISGFSSGVDFRGAGSIVEGLRVVGARAAGVSAIGIAAATGIVKGNIVSDIDGGPGNGVGIAATGIVTGNSATQNRITGISVGPGSSVIGNIATQTPGDGFAGISVDCPSNVTDNTAVNNNGRAGNLVLNGTGCNNTNNVAP